MDIERKYYSLRFLIWIFRLLGAVPMFAGIFAILAGSLAGVQSNKSGTAVALALLVSLAPILVGLVLWAIGELLQVAIDIEENTRRTRDELELAPRPAGNDAPVFVLP